MSYVHLATSEGVNIETNLELGFSIRKIAGRLRGQTFRYRELNTIVSEKGKIQGLCRDIRRAEKSFLYRCTDGKSIRCIDGACDLSIASLFPTRNVQNRDDRLWKRI